MTNTSFIVLIHQNQQPNIPNYATPVYVVRPNVKSLITRYLQEVFNPSFSLLSIPWQKLLHFGGNYFKVFEVLFQDGWYLLECWQKSICCSCEMQKCIIVDNRPPHWRQWNNRTIGLERLISQYLKIDSEIANNPENSRAHHPKYFMGNIIIIYHWFKKKKKKIVYFYRVPGGASLPGMTTWVNLPRSESQGLKPT